MSVMIEVRPDVTEREQIWHMKEQLEVYLNTMESRFKSMDDIYPVGSIYMSVNSTDPSTLFGGTWERIEDRFLLSAGSTYAAGSEDGAATVSLEVANLPSHDHSYTKPPTGTASHTLNVNEIPAHYHALRYQTTSTAGTSGGGYDWSGSHYYWSAATESSSGMKGAGGGQGHSHTISNTTANTGTKGSGTAHNNMPPYLAVYCWKRIA